LIPFVAVLAAAGSVVAATSGTGGRIAEALPRVEYQGGPFLREPRVVAVTFRGDDTRVVSALAAFAGLVTRSAWWQGATKGYCAVGVGCVGRGREARSVVVDLAWPEAVGDSDVSARLEEAIAAGQVGEIDAETVLLAFLPAGVAVEDGFGRRYCDGGPRAFHRMLRGAAPGVASAVLPRCGGLRELTATASHEVLEAATNPDPARRGFALTPRAAHIGFTYAGVEPVDPCGVLTRDGHRIEADGFVWQRAWSNDAAESGRDPCGGPAPFVALVPRTPTVRLRPGERRTVALDASSDRPTGTWRVRARAVTSGDEGGPCVRASLDRSRVASGDTVVLTLGGLRAPADEVCLVGLESMRAGITRLWPLAVVMRP
jgi:hypothetical protein